MLVGAPGTTSSALGIAAKDAMAAPGSELVTMPEHGAPHPRRLTGGAQQRSQGRRRKRRGRKVCTGTAPPPMGSPLVWNLYDHTPTVPTTEHRVGSGLEHIPPHENVPREARCGCRHAILKTPLTPMVYCNYLPW